MRITRNNSIKAQLQQERVNEIKSEAASDGLYEFKWEAVVHDCRCLQIKFYIH